MSFRITNGISRNHKIVLIVRISSVIFGHVLTARVCYMLLLRFHKTWHAYLNSRGVGSIYGLPMSFAWTLI